MRNVTRKITIVCLCALVSLLSVETLSAKKKPKRKGPRKATAKTVRTVVVMPSFVIKSVTTSMPDPALNTPILKAAPKMPVLSAPPPQPAATAGQLIISEFR